MLCIRVVSALFWASVIVPNGIAFAADDLEQQVEAARAAVVKEMEGASVTDADIEVSLPVEPLLQAVSAMNSAPPDQRTIKAVSNGANGKFWQDGPTWCNSFAELGSPDGFKANAVLSNFATSFPNPNTIAISADISVNANVDIHWHFKGRRVRTCVLGICANACPPGGGFGGHIGASGNKGLKLTGNLELVQDGGNFRYQVSLVDPPTVNMTITLGICVSRLRAAKTSSML